MGKIMLINGSPRAPKSNSRQYAQLFSSYSRQQTAYFEIKNNQYLELCRVMEEFSDVVFVFPLYVDSLPVVLLDFLKILEEHLPKNRPVISVMINCGFFEPHQNDIAIRMLRFFCEKNRFPFGSVYQIGSGEAILTTPFRLFLKNKMKKFAASVDTGLYGTFQITMPIPKSIFLKASAGYWEKYGKKYGVSKEEMQTMEIEA